MERVPPTTVEEFNSYIYQFIDEKFRSDSHLWMLTEEDVERIFKNQHTELTPDFKNLNMK